MTDWVELVGYQIEHLGRNETNYFMYQWVGPCVSLGDLSLYTFSSNFLDLENDVSGSALGFSGSSPELQPHSEQGSVSEGSRQFGQRFFKLINSLCHLKLNTSCIINMCFG